MTSVHELLPHDIAHQYDFLRGMRNIPEGTHIPVTLVREFLPSGIITEFGRGT